MARFVTATAILIAQLGQLSRPAGTHMGDIGAHCLKERQAARKNLLLAPDHDRQRPGDRPALSAAHRRVEQIPALGLDRLGNLAGGGRWRWCSCRSPLYPAAGRPGRRPAQDDLAHVGRVGDNADDDLAVSAISWGEAAPVGAVLNQGLNRFPGVCCRRSVDSPP